MTAGLYTARGGMRTLLIEKGALGGTVLLTGQYDNFPGYPGGVSSFELAHRMEEHMRQFEPEVVLDKITALRHLDSGPLFELIGENGTYNAKSVILASGSTPRMLDAPGIKKFFGKGISICAVCDAGFYKERDVAVIGGGDSAVEEGIYLTRFARSVKIVHRRDQLRARPEYVHAAFSNPKMEFVWDSVVVEVLGDDRVKGVVVRNTKTGEESLLDVEGVFVYIGADGNTGFVELPLERDELGYVKTGRLGETNIPGLFAAGDVRDEPFNQAIIACGHGAQAALMAEKYVSAIPKEVLSKYE